MLLQELQAAREKEKESRREEEEAKRQARERELAKARRSAEREVCERIRAERDRLESETQERIGGWIVLGDTPTSMQSSQPDSRAERLPPISPETEATLAALSSMSEVHTGARAFWARSPSASPTESNLRIHLQQHAQRAHPSRRSPSIETLSISSDSSERATYRRHVPMGPANLEERWRQQQAQKGQMVPGQEASQIRAGHSGRDVIDAGVALGGGGRKAPPAPLLISRQVVVAKEPRSLSPCEHEAPSEDRESLGSCRSSHVKAMRAQCAKFRPCGGFAVCARLCEVPT